MVNLFQHYRMLAWVLIWMPQVLEFKWLDSLFFRVMFAHTWLLKIFESFKVKVQDIFIHDGENLCCVFVI